MSKKKEFLTIQIDASELTPAQQRIIRYLNSMILKTLTTNDEAEYFDAANEAMRMLAELVKQANFTTSPSNQMSEIPYSEQALEFCVENMLYDLENKSTNIFDN